MQDESADAAMSIAVLHHLSSVSRRMALLLEMVRLLKPGGRGLVTVWASEQENTKKMSSWESLNSPDAHNSTGNICGGTACIKARLLVKICQACLQKSPPRRTVAGAEKTSSEAVP